MRISKKAEYALRALIVMAREPRSWQIQELSKAENIPVKFLEQILLALRHAGILASKRGVGGGYTLRADPARLTVGQVIAVLDGPLAPVPCAAMPAPADCTCPDPATCAVRLTMLDVRQKLEDLLGRVSIEDLVNRSGRPAALVFEI